jgi:hypothetical protein
LPVSGAVLTVTIDSGLKYESDSVPGNPIIDGNELIWNLSGLEPNINQQIDIFLSMSNSAEQGVAYPITANLEVVEPDVALDNNQDQTQVTFYENFIFMPFASTVAK